jgi:hypothetical protein
MPLFLIFIIFNSHTGHAVHHTLIHHSPFAEACLLLPHSLLRSVRGTSMGCRAENRTGPALQQADALSTMLRHTLAI